MSSVDGYQVRGVLGFRFCKSLDPFHIKKNVQVLFNFYNIIYNYKNPEPPNKTHVQAQGREADVVQGREAGFYAFGNFSNHFT